jgi:hypothetical protein
MKNTMRLSVWLCLSVVLSVSAQAQRPNVLVVMSDDHSAAHLGAYGNADIKTPNLDAFAKEGMLFKAWQAVRFTSTAPDRYLNRKPSSISTACKPSNAVWIM